MDSTGNFDLGTVKKPSSTFSLAQTVPTSTVPGHINPSSGPSNPTMLAMEHHQVCIHACLQDGTESHSNGSDKISCFPEIQKIGNNSKRPAKSNKNGHKKFFISYFKH